jgi:hypothetical protein
LASAFLAGAFVAAGAGGLLDRRRVTLEGRGPAGGRADGLGHGSVAVVKTTTSLQSTS